LQKGPIKETIFFNRDFMMIKTCTTLSFPPYGVAALRRLLKKQVSFAKEPYKRDDILQRRPTI